MTILKRHLRCRNRELAEAPGDLGRRGRHPQTGVEVVNFPNDSTLQRKLRTVEQRRRANTRSAGQGGHPELFHTDADGRDDAEPCNDWLSLHRLVPPAALGRVSPRNPSGYGNR